MSHCYHIIITIILLLSLLGIHMQIMIWKLPVRSVPLVRWVRLGLSSVFSFRYVHVLIGAWLHL